MNANIYSVGEKQLNTSHKMTFSGLFKKIKFLWEMCEAYSRIYTEELRNRLSKLIKLAFLLGILFHIENCQKNFKGREKKWPKRQKKEDLRILRNRKSLIGRLPLFDKRSNNMSIFLLYWNLLRKTRDTQNKRNSANYMNFSCIHS